MSTLYIVRIQDLARNCRKELRFFNYAENSGFYRANSFIWPSKKTEVPFCSFSPKVNFWGYMKITYVLNSSSNPANVELSSSKNSTISAFSTVTQTSESESLIAETSSSEWQSCTKICSRKISCTKSSNVIARCNNHILIGYPYIRSIGTVCEVVQSHAGHTGYT